MRKASKESDDNQERLGEHPTASLRPSNPTTESNMGGDRQPARLTASQQVVNAKTGTSPRLRGEYPLEKVAFQMHLLYQVLKIST